jgi:hypothetical protein
MEPTTGLGADNELLCTTVLNQPVTPVAVVAGVLGNARASYWKFLFYAATRYRHTFGTAVTLAIMGYHFNTITELVCLVD